VAVSLSNLWGRHVVHIDKRRRAAGLLRDLLDARITNDEYDNDFPDGSGDLGLSVIYDRIRLYYSGLHTHYLDATCASKNSVWGRRFALPSLQPGDEPACLALPSPAGLFEAVTKLRIESTCWAPNLVRAQHLVVRAQDFLVS
jgi:hypothetical protein